jgi:outer membrane protein
MKRTLLAVAAVCALSSGAAFAQQAEGPWMVRVRAVNLDSANKDSTGLGLSINNKWMPEVDVSYFFTPNIAAELVLTYPQKHDLRANGLRQIRSLKQMPPTLLSQNHITNIGAIKP